ncbi:MAG: rhodanese-like domain-containing protein [Actinomycetaceae bacterium]|nr:rhodanese-like domain-containing protein [Actinomycetaceae bacterium]
MQNIKKTLTTYASITLLLAGGSSMSSCSSDNAQPSTQTSISAQDVQKIIDNKEDALIIDVRTDSEYAGGHIPGAVNLSVDQINESTASKIIPSKDKRVVVYCRTGVRAGNALKTLKDLGYTNVSTLGGIQTDWNGEVTK